MPEFIPTVEWKPAYIFICISLLISSGYAQDDTLIIDEDAGLTLEMEAATLPPPPPTPHIHGALTLGAATPLRISTSQTPVYFSFNTAKPPGFRGSWPGHFQGWFVQVSPPRY